jgi:hypothetical protein
VEPQSDRQRQLADGGWYLAGEVVHEEVQDSEVLQAPKHFLWWKLLGVGDCNLTGHNCSGKEQGKPVAFATFGSNSYSIHGEEKKVPQDCITGKGKTFGVQWSTDACQNFLSLQRLYWL